MIGHLSGRRNGRPKGFDPGVEGLDIRIEDRTPAKVSIIVPVLNEADNICHLCAAITSHLRLLDEITFEIVLVDDGSRDGTWNVIHELHNRDPRVKGVRLSRNFGHQAALTAGLNYADGDAIITMDGDLQHPPEVLPEMIRKWRQGFHVVSMVRSPSRHDTWFKKISSRLFYRLLNAVSETPIRNSVADFRLLDRRVVTKLNSMRERVRFVRGLVSWIGFEEAELHYTPAPRFRGKSKYSLRKMLDLAAQALSSFSTAPLRMGFYAGMMVSVLCVVLMIYAMYNKLHENKDLTQWASTFMTMLFLNGIQLVMIGVIGLYLGRVLEEVRRRPVYIASEELGVTKMRRASVKRKPGKHARSRVAQATSGR